MCLRGLILTWASSADLLYIAGASHNCILMGDAEGKGILDVSLNWEGYDFTSQDDMDKAGPATSKQHTTFCYNYMHECAITVYQHTLCLFC